MSIGQSKTGASDVRSGKPTDARPIGAELYLLPVKARVPLRFGTETLTSVMCARVRLRIVGRDGREDDGWGETPLNVQWTWPGDLSVEERQQAMIAFCERLADVWTRVDVWGHPLDTGHHFQKEILPGLIDEFNRDRSAAARMPYLAGLVCCSPFDIALHDAYGQLHEVPTYATYRREYMNFDLGEFLPASDENDFDFTGKYPSDYLLRQPSNSLPVWHLVGALDPIDESELDGNEPNDGYPLVLTDWIDRDGLICLKVKLRGNDATWDYNRLLRVGRVGLARNVKFLTVDFNGTVQDPEYVIDFLDRLARDEPAVFDAIQFFEQPFPVEPGDFQMDVHSVSQRKPLLMDESASDWTHVKQGAKLGWNGVALKTCKTQTGVLLSLCWARANGMQLMVQDLTNPMLAQIPHVLLAAHADTTMGVESNAMQFYPDVSWFEARVHPGLYVRTNGHLDLSTVWGSGFGYRIDEINRPLQSPVARCGEIDGAERQVVRPHFLAKKDHADQTRPTG